MVLTALALALFAQSPASPPSSAWQVGPAQVRPRLLLELDGREPFTPEDGPAGISLGRGRAGLAVTFGQVGRAVFLAEWRQAPALLDAVIALSPAAWLDLLVGVKTVPLFFLGVEDVATYPFPDPELPVRSFWPGRNAGLETHLQPRALPLEAWLRVGHAGAGIPVPPAAGIALDGRFDLVFGREAEAATGQERLGLRVGVAARYERGPPRPALRGESPAGVPFEPAHVVSGTRGLLEAHLRAEQGPLTWVLEGVGERERLDEGPLRLCAAANAEAWLTVFGPWRRPGAWPVAGLSRAVELGLRGEAAGFDLRGAAPVTAWGGAVAARVWLSENLALAAAFHALRFHGGDRDRTVLAMVRATVNLR